MATEVLRTSTCFLRRILRVLAWAARTISRWVSMASMSMGWLIARRPACADDATADPTFATELRQMESERRCICDPEAVDAMAKADQQALIERVGSRAVAATMGAGGATPVPASVAAR